MNKKTKKKKVSYAWPIVLAFLSITLYLGFEYSDAYTKILCVYIGLTVLLPLTLTYSTNLAIHSIPDKKKSIQKSYSNRK